MIHSVLPYEFESSGSNGEIPEHIKYRTTINICFIAPLSALEVDNRSSSVPSVAQAVLRSEDDIELVTAGDVAMSTGFAMIERSPTLDPTNRRGTTQLQQLHGDDREGTGCGSGYLVDSPFHLQNSLTVVNQSVIKQRMQYIYRTMVPEILVVAHIQRSR